VKSKAFVIMAVVLLLVLPNLGCSRGKAIDKNYVNLMKMVPKGTTSFIFWDIQTLGGDVYPVWQEWKSAKRDWLNRMGGIAVDDVKFFFQASTPDLGIVTIVTGDFILSDVQEKLEKDSGYTPGEYLTIPRLTKAENSTELAVALYEGSIIVGCRELVEDCIKVVEGEPGSSSLYEELAIRGIAARLPSGVMTFLVRNAELYRDSVGLGMTVKKKDTETLEVKAVYKFEAAGAAASEDTLAKVKDDLITIDLAKMNLTTAEYDCFKPKATPEDEFIEATVSMHIEEFSYCSLA